MANVGVSVVVSAVERVRTPAKVEMLGNTGWMMEGWMDGCERCQPQREP